MLQTIGARKMGLIGLKWVQKVQVRYCRQWIQNVTNVVVLDIMQQSARAMGAGSGQDGGGKKGKGYKGGKGFGKEKGGKSFGGKFGGKDSGKDGKGSNTKGNVKDQWKDAGTAEARATHRNVLSFHNISSRRARFDSSAG